MAGKRGWSGAGQPEESPEQHLLGVIAEDDELLAYAEGVFGSREEARRGVLGFLGLGADRARPPWAGVPAHRWRAVLGDPLAWGRDSAGAASLTAPPGVDPLDPGP